MSEALLAELQKAEEFKKEWEQAKALEQKKERARKPVRPKVMTGISLALGQCRHKMVFYN